MDPAETAPRRAEEFHHISGLSYCKETWGVRSIDRYALVDQIGEGTYGKVFRATERGTQERVALKKMLPHHESEGFPRTETREIKLLKSVQHPNIVCLKEVVTSFGSATGSKPEAADATERVMGVTGTTTTDRCGDIYMVFEYVDYDLAGLLDSGYSFTLLQVKSLIYQLLVGLDHLHAECGYMHRDLKCSNLLLTDDHRLKIADFGLSRLIPSSDVEMTNKVITLWYRPPELLLGEQKYGPAVDMWSVGCIMIELLTGRPPFPAKSEAEQMRGIFGVVGPPPAESYLRTLRLWPVIAKEVEDRRPRLAEWLAKRPELAGDKDAQALLVRLLEPDPRKRMGAREALQAPWFTRAEPRISRDRPWELCAPPYTVSAGAGFKQGVDHHEFSSRARRKAVPGPGESGGGSAAAAAPAQQLPDAASAAVDALDKWVGQALGLPCDSVAEMRAAVAGLERAAGHLVTQLQGLATVQPGADGGSAAASAGGGAGGLEARVARLYNAVHTKLSAVNARLLAAEGAAAAAAAASAAPPPQSLAPRAGGAFGSGGSWPAEPALGGFGAAPAEARSGGGSRWGDRFDDRRRVEGAAAAGAGAPPPGGGAASRRGRSRSRSR